MARRIPTAASRQNTASATRACCGIFFASSGKPPCGYGIRDALTTKLYASSSMSSTCAKRTHPRVYERDDQSDIPAAPQSLVRRASTSYRKAGEPSRHHRNWCCPLLRKADPDHVEQFLIVHRLLKKCRCSCPQCTRLVALWIASGQHNHWNSRQGVAGLQALQHHKAVSGRQAQIENDHVRMLLLCRTHYGIAIA